MKLSGQLLNYLQKKNKFLLRYLVPLNPKRDHFSLKIWRYACIITNRGSRIVDFGIYRQTTHGLDHLQGYGQLQKAPIFEHLHA